MDYYKTVMSVGIVEEQRTASRHVEVVLVQALVGVSNWLGSEGRLHRHSAIWSEVTGRAGVESSSGQREVHDALAPVGDWREQRAAGGSLLETAISRAKIGVRNAPQRVGGRTFAGHPSPRTMAAPVCGVFVAADYAAGAGRTGPTAA